MTILLCDLAHTHSVDDTSLPVPLGLGYLKAYAVARYGAEVDIRLFKHPERLMAAAAEARPEIIGFANYGWNEALNRAVGRKLRALLPDTLMVAGGPNIDEAPARRRAFLDRHDYLDLIIVDGGEESFADLIAWRRAGTGDPGALPLNVLHRDGDGVRFTGARPLGKRIEGIESPYLGGHLDEFLAAGMVPMFESNRGCPFKCTFCAWGSASKDLVRRFDLETTLREIDYVGARSRSRNWIFCDANFGILKRDIEIAQAIRGVHDRTGFPRKCHIWLAKNATERNLDIGEILGDMTVPVMAVQSLDPGVLKAIKRDNISTDTYAQFQQKFHKLGSRTYSDLIVPLPNETLDSHLDALSQLIAHGVDVVMSHNMRLLAGAETNSAETRAAHGFVTRYRLIHGDAGAYRAPNGEILRCFEYEESLRATTTMSEADLFFLRKLHFLVDFAWNTEVYKPILRLLLDHGGAPVDLLRALMDRAAAPDADGPFAALGDFFAAFDAQSAGEWFDTPQAIESYFAEPANFDRLINQEFEKLNILFSLILLRDAKDAFDAAVLALARDALAGTAAPLDDVARVTFAMVPGLDHDPAPLTLEVAGDAVAYVASAPPPDAADGRLRLRLEPGERRREMQDLVRRSTGKTLSKVLNTQGYALRDMRVDAHVEAPASVA